MHVLATGCASTNSQGETESPAVAEGSTTPVSQFDDLEHAVASVGGTRATIHLDRSVALQNNVTIPGNIQLSFGNGSVVNTGNHELIVESPDHIIAGKRQRIVAGTRKLSFARAGTVPAFWMGATGDGHTDDTAALEAADASGTASIPAGVYAVKNLDLTHPPNFEGTVELIVLSGAQYGVKFSGDADGVGPVTGGLKVTAAPMDSVSRLVIVDGRWWSIPSLHIDCGHGRGEKRRHVGLEIGGATKTPLTHNYFGRIHVRRCRIGVHVNVPAGSYANNNQIAHGYIHHCNDGVAYTYRDGQGAGSNQFNVYLEKCNNCIAARGTEGRRGVFGDLFIARFDGCGKMLFADGLRPKVSILDKQPRPGAYHKRLKVIRGGDLKAVRFLPLSKELQGLDTDAGELEYDE